MLWCALWPEQEKLEQVQVVVKDYTGKGEYNPVCLSSPIPVDGMRVLALACECIASVVQQ